MIRSAVLSLTALPGTLLLAMLPVAQPALKRTAVLPMAARRCAKLHKGAALAVKGDEAGRVPVAGEVQVCPRRHLRWRVYRGWGAAGAAAQANGAKVCWLL